MPLNEKTIIECQWCQLPSYLENWENTTYSACTSRDMRRAYMHLTEVKAFYHNSGKFYKCPNCSKWLKGSQLIVKSTDIKLSKLGREPIVALPKNEIDTNTEDKNEY